MHLDANPDCTGLVNPIRPAEIKYFSTLWDADHLITGETAECRQQCPLGAKTEAEQRLLHTSLSRYCDGWMEVSGKLIKQTVKSRFVFKNKRINYDFYRHMIELELMRRIAGAKITEK